MSDTLDTLLAAYRTHKAVLDGNPPGAKGDRADARIAKVVERAEAAGVLDEFLAAI